MSTNDSHGRSPRQPNAQRKPPKAKKPSARNDPAAYLNWKRGADVGAEIAAHALRFNKMDAANREVRLSPQRRKAVTDAARILAVAVESGEVEVPYPVLFKHLFDCVTAKMTDHTPQKGRPPEVSAQFADYMMWWGAGELALMGEPQLTATELMASARVARVEREPKDLDTWRKYRKEYLPPEEWAAKHVGLLRKMRDLEAQLVKLGIQPQMAPDSSGAPAGRSWTLGDLIRRGGTN
jgi:hypothetical protein